MRLTVRDTSGLVFHLSRLLHETAISADRGETMQSTRTSEPSRTATFSGLTVTVSRSSNIQVNARVRENQTHEQVGGWLVQ